MQEAESGFQAQLASQVEKAKLDKEAALQALSGQHKSELEVAIAEKDRLVEVIWGLEQKLADKDQQLVAASELEKASKELIATLNRRATENDKKMGAIKVINVETTAELAVLRVTH